MFTRSHDHEAICCVHYFDTIFSLANFHEVLYCQTVSIQLYYLGEKGGEGGKQGTKEGGREREGRRKQGMKEEGRR